MTNCAASLASKYRARKRPANGGGSVALDVAHATEADIYCGTVLRIRLSLRPRESATPANSESLFLGRRILRAAIVRRLAPRRFFFLQELARGCWFLLPLGSEFRVGRLEIPQRIQDDAGRSVGRLLIVGRQHVPRERSACWWRSGRPRRLWCIASRSPYRGHHRC